MEVAARQTGDLNEAGVISSEEPGPATCADGEQQHPPGCGPGLAAGHGAGWIWGDPADRIPADAPLHTLLLAASRVAAAFYANVLVQAGLRVRPAGRGALR